MKRAIPALVAAAALACGGPLGPFPGGRLSGPVVPAKSGQLDCEPETVQLETNPADPHSVSVWCLGTGRAIYVPTSLILGTSVPTERQWVTNILADPRVRLRVDGQVLELRAERVTAPAELESTRRRLLARYETEEDEHARDAWIFRLVPR